MNPNNTTLAAAFIILCSQLLTLQPTLPFASYQWGEFTNVVEKLTVARQNSVREAVLASEIEEERTALVFVGDVMLGRNVEYLMDREGIAYPFQGLDLSTLYPDAAIVGNFESSMAPEHSQTPALAMKFSVPQSSLQALKDAHFTHVSLANNHSFDFGREGYVNAEQKLREHSLSPFGNATQIGPDSITYISTIRGEVALIGINATQRIPTDEEISSVLKRAAKRSSFQIISIHWGNEYELKHSNGQRMLAEAMVDAGADLIVGHHPHVTQDIDLIKGVVVFYSLGNYIFDQYFSNDVQEGLVIGLDLQFEPAITLLPISSKEALSQPVYMTPKTQGKFLQDLAKRSHPSLSKKIQAGVIPLLDTVATSTKVAMM